MMELTEYNTIYDIRVESEHFCFECHNEYYFNDEGGEEIVGLIYNDDLNTYLQLDIATKGSSGDRLMVCEYCVPLFISWYGDKIIPFELLEDDLDIDTHYILIKDTGYGDVGDEE